MMNRKTVIVTGGGSGIGAAISHAFIATGYEVVIAQRSQPNFENTHWVRTDVSHDADCEALINHVGDEFGRLDALINNAGIMRQSPLESTSSECWDQTMAVNLRAPFLLTKLALPLLKAHHGSIVNIGSIEGIAANPNHSAYSVSKAGLHALTRATAVDHGQLVRCNGIAPGWIDTELNTDFIESMPDPVQFREQIGAIHPTGRTGTPEEVASLAVFLCSEGASFINGQTLTVDGGRTAKLPMPSC